MSDTPEAPATEESFPDRTEAEQTALSRQMRAGSPHTYIAPPAPGHNVVGLWHYFPAHTRTGYAAHAIALHTMLIDMGIPTSLVPHRLNSLDIDSFPKDRAELLTKWMADAVGLPEAYIASLPPDVAMSDMAPALVNYVAAETTSVSAKIVEIVNDDKLKALWCVSDFTAQAYRAGGANPDKVFTVRPPICDGIWKSAFKQLGEPRPDPGDAPFIFGTLGTWHERKGFHDLIRAYFRRFKRTENVELHIRTSSFDSRLTIKKFEEKIIAEIAEIAKEFGDFSYPTSKRQPKIVLLTGTGLTDAEVIGWLGSLDCYVNPSYGEGLGIPHMWTLAQGVPLISSDFGAVGQFLCETDNTGLMFESKTIPVPVSMRTHAAIFGDRSEWGGYSVDALADAMVAARSRAYPLPVGYAGFVRHFFSYAACRPSLEAAMRHLVPADVKWGAPE